jgi:phospholipid N-methyltransferase
MVLYSTELRSAQEGWKFMQKMRPRKNGSAELLKEISVLLRSGGWIELFRRTCAGAARRSQRYSKARRNYVVRYLPPA